MRSKARVNWLHFYFVNHIYWVTLKPHHLYIQGNLNTHCLCSNHILAISWQVPEDLQVGSIWNILWNWHHQIVSHIMILRYLSLTCMQFSHYMTDCHRELGSEWQVSAVILKQLEIFICVMGGYPRDTSDNVVRSKMLKKMFGNGESLHYESRVNFASLPPCQISLVPHIQVKYRVACYKRAAEPNFMRPHLYKPGPGWEKS